MVLEHQRAHESRCSALESLAEKMGGTSDTLRKWLRRQAERVQGRRVGLRSAVHARHEVLRA